MVSEKRWKWRRVFNDAEYVCDSQLCQSVFVVAAFDVSQVEALNDVRGQVDGA